MKLTLHEGIEIFGVGKGLLKVLFRLLDLQWRHHHLAAQRLLINQLLEDHHLYGAVANLSLKFFWNPIVLASVWENRKFLAHQVGLGQNRAIDVRDRLACGHHRRQRRIGWRRREDCRRVRRNLGSRRRYSQEKKTAN